MQADIFEDVMPSVARLMCFCMRAFEALVEDRLQGSFSVTQARILVELAQQPSLTATDLCRTLCLGAGYLSRTLGWFEQQGLITRIPAGSDARQRLLSLTPAGKHAYSMLARPFHEEGTNLFADLSAEDRQRVLNALLTILEQALKKRAAGH